MLSTGYHHSLFWEVLEREKPDECLKTLTLCSREMSDAFFVFMKNVRVEYSHSGTRFCEETTSQGKFADYEADMDECLFWVTHFVRNFVISLRPLYLHFYKERYVLDAFVQNVLQKSNLIFLDASDCSLPKENLESVAAVPRLTISDLQLPEFKTSVSYFGSLRVVNFYDKLYKNIAALNLDGSQLTVIDTGSHDSYAGLLQQIKDELDPIRNFCFMWLDDGQHNISVEFQAMFNVLKTLSHNIEKVTIVVFGGFSIGNPDFAAGYWKTVKSKYNEMIVNLLEIPKHINIEAYLQMDSSVDLQLANPINLLVPIFSNEDFIVTAKDSYFEGIYYGFHLSCVTVINRQKKIGNNIDFTFECKIRFYDED